MTEPLITENINKEKFLLIFEPKQVENRACCCCTLKNGIKCLSIFFLFSSGSCFIDSLKTGSILLSLTSIIYSILYVVSAFYLFVSVVNLKEIYAKVAYICYEIIILFQITLFLIYLVLIIFGAYKPFQNNENVILVLIAFIISFGIIISLDIYFLWIIFSFRVLLIKGDIGTVIGDELTNILNNESEMAPIINTNINTNQVTNLP